MLKEVLYLRGDAGTALPRPVCKFHWARLAYGSGRCAGNLRGRPGPAARRYEEGTRRESGVGVPVGRDVLGGARVAALGPTSRPTQGRLPFYLLLKSTFRCSWMEGSERYQARSL